ncbi:hypothetical protein BC834DRAFT_892955 [Gloeopeniophorella convolvens]|nr:hypothetical protein BC834DRAFT_892955 [Gloeopeniophorella convolvens]
MRRRGGVQRRLYSRVRYSGTRRPRGGQQSGRARAVLIKRGWDARAGRPTQPF